MLLLLLGLMMFGIAIYVFAEAATATARQRSVAIGRATRYGELSRQGAAELKFRERVLEPGVARLARISLKLNPRMTVQTVEAKLLSAGLARKVTPTAFLATKAALGVAGLAFGTVVGGTLGGKLAALPFAFLCTFIGFALPGMVLTMKVRARKEVLRMKLAERAAAPEVGHLTRAIIQADVLGISLGRILKVQASDTRDRRQAAAEEKAMKAPIKMLFPTVLFIFPAMFLVILGPAMLTINEIF